MANLLEHMDGRAYPLFEQTLPLNSTRHPLGAADGLGANGKKKTRATPPSTRPSGSHPWGPLPKKKLATT